MNGISARVVYRRNVGGRYDLVVIEAADGEELATVPVRPSEDELPYLDAVKDEIAANPALRGIAARDITWV
jgi:hypothetical protein